VPAAFLDALGLWGAGGLEVGAGAGPAAAFFRDLGAGESLAAFFMAMMGM
jgi:hypothetical protein